MTLKIEAGRYYRTREGRKVGPMDHYSCSVGNMHPWHVDGCGMLWKYDGTGYEGKYPDNDLIAEWTDEPAATDDADGLDYQRQNIPAATPAAKPLPHGHACLPSGEVIDLTAIITPFGLLPADVQQALRDHGGPWECWQSNGNWEAIKPGWGISQTYRVRPLPPAPKVREVTAYLRMTPEGEVVIDGFETGGVFARITMTLRDGVPDHVAKVEAL